MFQKVDNVQQLLDAKLQLNVELTESRVSTMASRLAEDLIRAKNQVVDELVTELRRVKDGST